MSRHLVFVSVLALVLTSILPSAVLAVELPWEVQLVDSIREVGEHVAVAVDPVTGTTFVAYYDAGDSNLWLAFEASSGGNCGPANSWSCRELDASGDVGRYPAIALVREGSVVQFFISYYDASNGALKVVDASWVAPLTVDWATSTVDTGILALSRTRGTHTDIVIDSGGRPQVAYRYSNAFGTDSQMYAHYVGAGNGNCGAGPAAGYWQCDAVFSADGIGTYGNIELGPSEHPYIAFYDPVNGYPMVARHVGSGGNCGPTDDWSCQSVDWGADDRGQMLSMFIDSSGLEHLAYYNATTESLEYARRVNSGGNCGYSGTSGEHEWECAWIDDMGTNTAAMDVAIAGDHNDNPIIAYQSAADLATSSLKVARPIPALDFSPVPNCGPQDLFYTWYCKLVDGGTYTDEARSVAVATDRAGQARIAYHELDSYPYPAENNLKVAFEVRATLFADGFESSSTSRWSRAVQ